MKALLVSMALGFGFVAASAAHAQAPAGAPAGSTGLCKDGTYTSGDSKKGACRGHKGVKDWYAGTAAAPAANDAAPPAEKTKKPKKDSAAAPAAAPTASTAKPADATGLCKDGTYYTGESKKGACRGHKGVKDWYAGTSAAPAANDAAAPAEKTKKSKKDNAAAPAAAPTASTAKPADATGLCKDGTYYTGETKKGACRGHKGVQDWYGATAAAPTKASAPTPAAPATPAPKMAPAPMPAAPAAPASKTPAAPPAAAPAPPIMLTVPAAGGGNGKVWVNNETKVYHCEGDRYYGRTKQGEYMTEADAVAKGARPSHGNACAK